MAPDGPRIDVCRDSHVLGTVLLDGAARRWLVGRSAEADIVVNHPLVSRQHAAISEDAGAFYVTDLGSAHGTKVMGQSIAPNEPFRLFDGLSITVGGAARELVPRGTIVGLTAAVAAAARAQAAAARREEAMANDDDDDDEAEEVARHPAGGEAEPTAAHAMGAALLSGGMGSSAMTELAAQNDEDEALRAMFPLQLGKVQRESSGPSLEQQHAAFARSGPTAAKGGKRGLKMAPKLGATLGTGLGVAAASPTLVALQKTRAEEAAAAAKAARKAGAGRAGSSMGGGATAAMMGPPPPRRPAGALAPSRPEGWAAEEEEEEEDDVGPSLPPGFAASNGGGAGGGESDSDSDDIGPPLPPGFAGTPSPSASAVPAASARLPLPPLAAAAPDETEADFGPQLPSGMGGGGATDAGDGSFGPQMPPAVDFGPQMPPGFGGEQSDFGPQLRPGMEGASSADADDFGPQLPPGMGSRIPEGYDPEDLSQQVRPRFPHLKSEGRRHV